MIRIHEYTTSCATTFVQWGGITALRGSQIEAEGMVKEFDRRRNLVYSALKEMPGIYLGKPKGAFYIFPNIKPFEKTPEEMPQYLLEQAHISIVSGTTLMILILISYWFDICLSSLVK